MTEKLRICSADPDAIRVPIDASSGDVALRILRADVLGPRPNQPVVRVLLEDVRGPAGDAAHRENRREQVDRDPERVVGGRRVEIDVRVELLFRLDQRLDALRHLEPDRLAGALAEIARHLAQVRRARILGVVDAVTEAGNLFLPRQLGADDFFGLLDRRVGADLEQQPHHVGVGAAVQRALQRADRADDRRVDVGERRGGDAGREGGRVQLVVGVQHQRDVEGARRQTARPLAGQHVEEVRRVAEHRIRLRSGRRRPPTRPIVATSELICAVRRTALR